MNKYEVAIVTGWSNAGGSTESYINLTNALNDNGVPTIMLGRHTYHLDKCESGQLSDLEKYAPKNMIWHFIPMPDHVQQILRPRNLILSCHEHGLNPIFEKYPLSIFNKVHFVSQHQMDWHLGNSNKEWNDTMVVIPNLLDPKLIENPPRPTKKVGGVIGSIDRNKQTHISIMKALADGCETVRIFGKDTDLAYHAEYVCPILKDPRVMYHGVVEDKNKMYSSITDVYHYSAQETWGYIKAECQYLNIPFHCRNKHDLVLTKTDDIINSWKEILI